MLQTLDILLLLNVATRYTIRKNNYTCSINIFEWISEEETIWMKPQEKFKFRVLLLQLLTITYDVRIVCRIATIIHIQNTFFHMSIPSGCMQNQPYQVVRCTMIYLFFVSFRYNCWKQIGTPK
jgi:hypothetical protein